MFGELKLNLSELALQQSNDALNTLADVIKSDQRNSTRIATTILDQRYGKPRENIPLKTIYKALCTTFRYIFHKSVLIYLRSECTLRHRKCSINKGAYKEITGTQAFVSAYSYLYLSVIPPYG